jgi:serine/threonine-protein kinase
MTSTGDEPDYGRYELLARIGDGPRGPRFVAHRRGDVAAADLLYAIELSMFATGEDEALRGFLFDVERVAQLQHRNLVGVVELGATPTGMFVVADYIEGCTLSEIEERHRAIRPPRLVLAALIDALHGLDAAHALTIAGVARPLVHGGIRPDHIQLGVDGTCRMSGFGNARPRVQTRPSHRTRSATGYMAPEQLTGGDVDPRSDLFSAGVVLWNALTGKKLFHDRLEHTTMSNVLERKVPRPSTIGLSPPIALDAAVLKALERDPAQRYHSAGEMASALRDAARTASCLAAGSEVAEWITTTFGTELAARRRMLRELTAQPRGGVADLSALPGLGDAPELAARDELSLDELSRASGPLPRAPAVPAPPPFAARDGFTRRQLVVVASVALAIVAAILLWRRSQTQATQATQDAVAITRVHEPASAGPPMIALEVTVLDVRGVAPAAPAPAPTAEPEPHHGAQPTTAPARTPARIHKSAARPTAPPHPSEAQADPPEPKPAEPKPEPPRPEPPPRPTLESNPYLYK